MESVRRSSTLEIRFYTLELLSVLLDSISRRVIRQMRRLEGVTQSICDADWISQYRNHMHQMRH